MPAAAAGRPGAQEEEQLVMWRSWRRGFAARAVLALQRRSSPSGSGRRPSSCRLEEEECDNMYNRKGFLSFMEFGGFDLWGVD